MSCWVMTILGSMCSQTETTVLWSDVTETVSIRVSLLWMMLNILFLKITVRIACMVVRRGIMPACGMLSSWTTRHWSWLIFQKTVKPVSPEIWISRLLIRWRMTMLSVSNMKQQPIRRRLWTWQTIVTSISPVFPVPMCWTSWLWLMRTTILR